MKKFDENMINSKLEHFKITPERYLKEKNMLLKKGYTLLQIDNLILRVSSEKHVQQLLIEHDYLITIFDHASLIKIAKHSGGGNNLVAVKKYYDIFKHELNLTNKQIVSIACYNGGSKNIFAIIENLDVIKNLITQNNNFLDEILTITSCPAGSIKLKEFLNQVNVNNLTTNSNTDSNSNTHSNTNTHLNLTVDNIDLEDEYSDKNLDIVLSTLDSTEIDMNLLFDIELNEIMNDNELDLIIELSNYEDLPKFNLNVNQILYTSKEKDEIKDYYINQNHSSNNNTGFSIDIKELSNSSTNLILTQPREKRQINRKITNNSSEYKKDNKKRKLN